MKRQNLWKRMKKCYVLYLFLLPAFLMIAVFCYAPMYGVLMAFQNYSPSKGITGSSWVGLKWFRTFFNMPRFWQIVKNTLTISLYSLIAGFPIPVILALMINSVRNTRFQKVTQTITYMPHFISVVILVGMLTTFLSPRSGFLSHILTFFGASEEAFYMGDAKAFPHLYVWSGIWQDMGWSSIIYLAALAGVDQSLHEAAKVDGASKWQCIRKITLPLLKPTVVVLFLLSVGNMLKGNLNMIIGLTNLNPVLLSTTDLIDVYVYRSGVRNGEMAFASAISLYQSVFGLILVVISNKIAGKVDPESTLF